MAHSSVAQQYRRQGGGSYYSYVKPEFRRGYEVPLLDYQKGGIITRPLWNTKNHVIRIIPGYDQETGEVFRQNIKVNEYAPDAPFLDYLSDTVMQASTLQMFGEQKQTLLSDYAPGSPDAQRWGGDTALHVFIRNVLNAVQGKRKTRFGVTSDMKRWADPRQGVVRFPKQSLLFQALIFTANDRDSADRDGNLLVDDQGNVMPLLAVVSVDGKQTVQAILSALVEPSNPGLPLDALTNNKFGGMAEANGNKLFLNHVTDPQTGYNYLRPSVQKPGKGWTPTPYPLTEDNIRALWHPWDELLQFLTVEEQLKLLSSEFGADSVNYLVGTDPMYVGYNMPDEIARAGYGRYAKLTGGVKDVAQTVHLGSSPSQPQQSVAAPKHEQLGAQQPAQHKDALSGLQNTNTIDTEKLRAEVERLRAATQKKPAMTIEDRASKAEELLAGAEVEYEPEDIGL